MRVVESTDEIYKLLFSVAPSEKDVIDEPLIKKGAEWGAAKKNVLLGELVIYHTPQSLALKLKRKELRIEEKNGIHERISSLLLKN